MTTIQRFDPFREMQQLRRLRHGPRPFFIPFPAFRDGAAPEPADAPAATTAAAWSIPLDVRRDDRQLTVSAALPGFAADEVEVSISPDRVLSVKAARQTATASETEQFLLRERRAGRFARAIRLPADLDLDAAAVNLEHGILTVTAPVAAAAQTRKLTIGGGAANAADDADAGIDDSVDAIADVDAIANAC